MSLQLLQNTNYPEHKKICLRTHILSYPDLTKITYSTALVRLPHQHVQRFFRINIHAQYPQRHSYNINNVCFIFWLLYPVKTAHSAFWIECLVGCWVILDFNNKEKNSTATTRTSSLVIQSVVSSIRNLPQL